MIIMQLFIHALKIKKLKKITGMKRFLFIQEIEWE